tara:strand:+ start:1119 stop:1499 length:381 start_codon:yes stop_codon:yes gene_type:complete
MFKIYITIISFILLILSIYASTIITIEYFDKNDKKQNGNNLENRDPWSGGQFNPQIRKSELELEKKQMEAHTKREIEAIELQLEKIKNNDYELLEKQLELQKKHHEDNLNLDLMRMDLEILRMNVE